MYEKFCPNIHGVCRDGHPDNDSRFCAFWDTLNGECVFVKSMQATADGQRLTNQLLQMKVETVEQFWNQIKAKDKPSG